MLRSIFLFHICNAATIPIAINSGAPEGNLNKFTSFKQSILDETNKEHNNQKPYVAKTTKIDEGYVRGYCKFHYMH